MIYIFYTILFIIYYKFKYIISSFLFFSSFFLLFLLLLLFVISVYALWDVIVIADYYILFKYIDSLLSEIYIILVYISILYFIL
jgi:hypothetical protein